MLDREHAVITGPAERQAEGAPEILPVAIAERDIIPCPLQRLRARQCLDPAVQRGVPRLDLRVLGVNMIDRRADRLDRRDRVGPHPHQVARVEVHANDIADGLAEPHQRAHIVDVLPAMQL